MQSARSSSRAPKLRSILATHSSSPHRLVSSSVKQLHKLILKLITLLVEEECEGLLGMWNVEELAEGIQGILVRLLWQD